MNKSIDARGLSCPQPVLMALEAIRKQDATDFEILVDTETARENVIRAAKKAGCEVIEAHAQSGEYRIVIKKKL